MIDARTLQDDLKFQETAREISNKVLGGEYRLLRRKQGNSVWKIYREIVRSDGAIISGLYFCTGCKRVMRSFNTSNLRTHKCHVEYLRQSVDTSTGTFRELEPLRQQDTSPTTERRPNTAQPAEWSFLATEMLLQLWAGHVVDLRDSRKRVDIIWKIAAEMKTLGFTFLEIKNKMDDMAQQYRREAHMEKTTGEKSQWEFFSALQKLLTADHNLVEFKPKTTVNSRNGSHSISDHNSFSNQPNLSSKNQRYSRHLKEESTEEEDFNEDLEGYQEDVDELRILKDNIIREIEESSTVHSQENYEEELDQQISQIEEKKRVKRKRSARMIEIEEQKLVIERKKCKLMKFFVREMSSFHQSLFELLNNSQEVSKP
ncbi:uncharacterized protein LOC108100722 [Drosophila ficusphila]|uniref:uncharacterized protein LOC108100722 n=1 Tax=Drosophila ficusphila TaxID=30025 RepID=UPI0007E83F45|nr:uncharacterized protein LOC108100722 [Drosophila ficusphila]